jgi:hypothetical protein
MTTPQQTTPRRTREQTAWWTVFTVLSLSVVLMLGLRD